MSINLTTRAQQFARRSECVCRAKRSRAICYALCRLRAPVRQVARSVCRGHNNVAHSQCGCLVALRTHYRSSTNTNIVCGGQKLAVACLYKRKSIHYRQCGTSDKAAHWPMQSRCTLFNLVTAILLRNVPFLNSKAHSFIIKSRKTSANERRVWTVRRPQLRLSVREMK